MTNVTVKRSLPVFALLALGCTTETEPEVPKCTPASGTICTIAGNDIQGLAGDGQAANEASLYWPMDISEGPDGHLYVVDWNNHRIRRIAKDTGRIATIAGTDDIGDGPDGPALESHFNHPTNITFDNDGNLLIAAWHNSKVKLVDLTSSTITDTCGDGKRAYGGDGGPAKLASFDLPGAIAVADDGTLYIMDQANQRIRTVDNNGTVNNYAGGPCLVNACMEGEVPEACPTGQKMVCNKAMNEKLCSAVPGCLGGFGGDDGPASAITMWQPVSQSADPGGRIAFDQDGNLFFSDMLNHRVRRIDKETKVVTTVAGSGEKGYGGDGGQATQAKLNRPSDLAFAPDGTLYIADTFNSCIRAVHEGIIDTVVGQCEKDGFDGDEGAPTLALLNRPYGVLVAGNGDLYVVDTYNGRVRVVAQ